MQCDPGSQFTCNDGTCVSLEYRCNQKPDCVDKSDEISCTIMLMDESNYDKQHTPQNTTNSKHALNVFASLGVLMLGEFSEIDLSYKIKFLFEVQWFDQRLSFQNLGNDTYRNIIGTDEKKQIWTPPLSFNNSDKTTSLTIDRSVDEPSVNIYVKRSGRWKVAPPSYLHEAYLYKGSENPLIMRTEYNLKVQCVYLLSFYPFDHQLCRMQVRYYCLKLFI